MRLDCDKPVLSFHLPRQISYPTKGLLKVYKRNILLNYTLSLISLNYNPKINYIFFA